MIDSRTHVCLVSIADLSETTREFRFISEDGSAVRYEPGQFYRFLFTDDKGQFERSYSLCNLGADVPAGALDLVVSKVDKGRATALLFNCQKGLKATVTGPYGRLLLPQVPPRRLIMVCTSVGIAPFLPMLDQIFRVSPDRFSGTEVVVLFGIRSPDECLYRDYLLSLKHLQHPHLAFEVTFCFSRHLPRPQSAEDYCGYVQDQLKLMALNPSDDQVYLCGNPMMIDDCYALLKERGFKSKQVIREKYVFAKDIDTKEKGSKSDKMSVSDLQLLEEKIRQYQKKK